MTAWICSSCGAEIDSGFDACWRCGTDSGGTPDSDFVPEIDVATYPPNIVRTIQCGRCGYQGKILRGRYQYPWWALWLTPVLLLTVIGLPLPFLWLRFTKFLRFNLCPKCREGKAIRDWYGEILADNEALWNTTQTNEDLRFDHQRLRILIVILATLISVLLIPMIRWLL